MTIPPEPRRAASTRSSTRPKPPESRAGSSAGLSSSRALSPSTPLGRDAPREQGRKGRPDFLDRFLSAIPLLAVYFGLAALFA